MLSVELVSLHMSVFNELGQQSFFFIAIPLYEESPVVAGGLKLVEAVVLLFLFQWFGADISKGWTHMGYNGQARAAGIYVPNTN